MALPESEAEARTALLRQAVASVEESLAIERQMRNEIGTAASLSQLCVLHRFLGDIETAEHYVRDAMAIRERIHHSDVYKDYANLEEIAQLRGDTGAAAEWRCKKEAKLAELRCLRAGPAGAGQLHLPPDFLQALRAMAQDAHHRRTSGNDPSPEFTEAAAKLATFPAPLPAFAAFLTAVATGAPLPAIPSDLSPELAEILRALARDCV
jgi:hypothetical protein